MTLTVDIPSCTVVVRLYSRCTQTTECLRKPLACLFTSALVVLHVRLSASAINRRLRVNRKPYVLILVRRCNDVK